MESEKIPLSAKSRSNGKIAVRIIAVLVKKWSEIKPF